jgi:uncharacterized repeat protein (TIGR01451 family)
MATVGGQVYFDKNRTGAVGSSAPFNAVTVLLQDLLGTVIDTATTNSFGVFQFDNVANGNYFVSVERPSISLAPSPPPAATHLDFLSKRNNQITIAGADVAGLVYILGPVIYTPLNIIPPDVVIDPINLIECADSGTFGGFEKGSAVNRGADPEPYTALVPDFAYVLPNPSIHTPDDSEYGIQNVMTDNLNNVIGSWWRVADHTTGDETGRFQIVNGDNPSSSFFCTTVNVKPNTYYFFSAWFLNMFKVTGYAPPRFGVKVTDTGGQLIWYADIGSQIPERTDMPEWKQKGAVIHTEQHETLTIEFLSEAPKAWGNDYCVDDVSLHEITIPEPDPPCVKIVKEADKDCLPYGEEVIFTVTIQNKRDMQMTDVQLKDALPKCLAFVLGSVTIDGTNFPTYNPNTGFKFNLLAGQTKVIKFKATPTCYPKNGYVCNIATVIYPYEIFDGGIPVEFRVDSEPICVNIPKYSKDKDGNIVILPKGVH